jgi:hypothetical protein
MSPVMLPAIKRVEDETVFNPFFFGMLCRPEVILLRKSIPVSSKK